jgi:polysaccharide biosynthesis/export protein
MKNNFKSMKIVIVAALVLCQISQAAYAVADSQPVTSGAYRVAAGDVIFLTVPARPDLSGRLTVDAQGRVALPVVGPVKIAGLTTKDAETKIFQALKEYYPSLTGVKLEMEGEKGQTVYVLGQVGKPGKYSFQTTPNLWEAIREAGGPTQNASLDNVRIVSDKSRGGITREVNVMAALESGSMEQLPTLNNDDTVVIPASGTQAVYSGTFGVNVIGAVVKPGIYRLQSRQDLMSAILMAGGPTDRAALSRIKIIRPGKDNNVQTIEIDLDKYLKEGDPLSNPKLEPGDTVHIPSQNHVAYLFKNDLGFVLNIVTTGVTIAVLIVSVRNYRQ